MFILALWIENRGQIDCDDLLNLIQEYKSNPQKLYLVVTILECAEGDNLALSRTIAKYIDDKNLRQDFIQELFEQMCANLKKAEIKSNVKGYLFNAVKFACINFKNRADNKRSHLDVGEIKEEDVQGSKVNKFDFPKEDRELWMNKIKQVLNEKELYAVIEIYREKRTYKEVASEMNMGLTPFRGLIYRAIQKLRNSFGEDFWKYFKE